MPCIEYWFLLHFKKQVSTREYLSYDELKPELKKHIDDYEKTEKYFEKYDVYQKLISGNKQENAIKLAKNLDELRMVSDSKTFPFSDMYILLEELERKS